MKNPRFEDDNFELTLPDDEKIQCKGCFLREADRTIGDTVVSGATLGICKVFQSKPREILFENAKCPYFIDEKE